MIGPQYLKISKSIDLQAPYWLSIHANYLKKLLNERTKLDWNESEQTTDRTRWPFLSIFFRADVMWCNVRSLGRHYWRHFRGWRCWRCRLISVKGREKKNKKTKTFHCAAHLNDLPETEKFKPKLTSRPHGPQSLDSMKWFMFHPFMQMTMAEVIVDQRRRKFETWTKCWTMRMSTNKCKCEVRVETTFVLVFRAAIAGGCLKEGRWVVGGGVRVYANRWSSGDSSLFDNSLVQWRTSVLSVRPRCRKFRVGLTRERSSTVSLRCAERTKRRRSIPSASF